MLTIDVAIGLVASALTTAVCVGSIVVGCGFAIVAFGGAAIMSVAANHAAWSGRELGREIHEAIIDPFNWVDTLIGQGGRPDVPN